MERFVLKAGGSVLSDIQAYDKVAHVVQNLYLNPDYKLLGVVVSAMGKTTDKLEAMARDVCPDGVFRGGRDAERETAALVATGEIQSAALLAKRLNGLGIVQSYNAFQAQIYTDDNFCNAKIKSIGNVLPNAVSAGILPIIAGFQGITKDGDFTILSREGSDITAIECALKLHADFCWFFKDGGRIYDKNPNKYTDAKALDFITYQEMLNIIDSRPNQVLHRECVKRAKEEEMPLRVSSMHDLKNCTWIGSSRWWDSRNKHR